MMLGAAQGLSDLATQGIPSAERLSTWSSTQAAMSYRSIMSGFPVRARCLGPSSKRLVNFFQASAVGCCPRNLRSPSPQPPEDTTPATRSSTPPQ